MDPLMFSGGNDYGRWLLLLAAIGMLVGFAWVRRITSLGENPDRSFSRLSERLSTGLRIPNLPEIPTRGWLLTRGAILIGVGAIGFALVGPQFIRRWNPASEAGAIAVAVWIVAVLAATVGTVWMVRIAIAGPEDGATRWRSRR